MIIIYFTISHNQNSDFWVGEDLESTSELYDVDGLIVWQSAADKSLCDNDRRNQAEKSALKFKYSTISYYYHYFQWFKTLFLYIYFVYLLYNILIIK